MRCSQQLVGARAPIPRHQAAAFWRGRIEAIAAGTCVLLAAFDGGKLVGSVQITLDTPPNQRHRADINKLVVLRGARRRGTARALMEAVRREAAVERRTLLTLDTRKDDAAEPLYRSLGYIETASSRAIRATPRERSTTRRSSTRSWASGARAPAPSAPPCCPRGPGGRSRGPHPRRRSGF